MQWRRGLQRRTRVANAHGKRERKPKKLESKPVKENFSIKVLQDKWITRSARYKDLVAYNDVKNHKLKGESGAGGDASMSRKVAGATAAWLHFEAIHETFGTMAWFDAGNITESLTGAAAHLCNRGGMCIENARGASMCASACKHCQSAHVCGVASRSKVLLNCLWVIKLSLLQSPRKRKQLPTGAATMTVSSALRVQRMRARTSMTTSNVMKPRISSARHCPWWPRAPASAQRKHKGAAAASKRAHTAINAAPGKPEPAAKRRHHTVESSKAVAVASAAATAAAKELRSSSSSKDAVPLQSRGTTRCTSCH